MLWLKFIFNHLLAVLSNNIIKKLLTIDIRLSLNNDFIPEKIFWIMVRIRNGRFLRMFTVAFLLFLVPTGGGSNPVDRSLSLTHYLPSSVYVKIRRNHQLQILPLTQNLSIYLSLPGGFLISRPYFRILRNDLFFMPMLWYATEKVSTRDTSPQAYSFQQEFR